MSEGWWQPAQSKKWHYFGEDGRALCRKWAAMKAAEKFYEQGNDDSSENCAECKRRKQKGGPDQLPQTKERT